MIFGTNNRLYQSAKSPVTTPLYFGFHNFEIREVSFITTGGGIGNWKRITKKHLLPPLEENSKLDVPSPT